MPRDRPSPPFGSAADGLSFPITEAGPNRYLTNPMPPAHVGIVRLAGGQVAAESLLTAHRSTGRMPHSLHLHFVSSGTVDTPVAYEVETLRAGRTSTLLHIGVSQNDVIRAVAMISCTEEPDRSDGPDWFAPLPGDLLDPDTANDLIAPASTSPAMANYDVRVARRPADGAKPAVHPFWARAKRSPGPELIHHLACIAFVTDIGVSATARPPGTPIYQRLAGTSLDHVVWFQRPARADEWLLIEAEAVSFSSSRGVAHGTVRTADGTLVAVISQEALAMAPPPLAASKHN